MPSNCGAGEDSLTVLWTAGRSKKSILKEISPEDSLEGLMLKLQYVSHLIQRAYSLEKTLRWGRLKAKEKGQHRMRRLDGVTSSVDMTVSTLQEIVADRGAWRAAVRGGAKSRAQLSSWTIAWRCWLYYKTDDFGNYFSLKLVASIFSYKSSIFRKCIFQITYLTILRATWTVKGSKWFLSKSKVINTRTKWARLCPLSHTSERVLCAGENKSPTL